MLCIFLICTSSTTKNYSATFDFVGWLRKASIFVARPMNYGHWYWYCSSFGNFRRQPIKSLHQNPDTTPLKTPSVTGGCLISFCAKRRGHEGIAKWSTLSQKGTVTTWILPRSACDSDMDCASAFCHVMLNLVQVQVGVIRLRFLQVTPIRWPKLFFFFFLQDSGVVAPSGMHQDTNAQTSKSIQR